MSEANNSDSNRLAQLLDQALKSLRRSVFLQYVTSLVITVLGAILLGTLVVYLGAANRWGALVSLTTTVAGFIGFTLRAIRQAISVAQGPLSVARWMDNMATRGRAVGLLDAAEIHRDLGSYGESQALSHSAVQKATQFAETNHLLGRVLSESQQAVRVRVISSIILIILTFAAAFFAPDELSRVLQALSSKDGLEAALIPAPPEPRLGEIRIEYRYPEYTHRANRTAISATGHVHALPGTEVTVSTRVGRPLQNGAAVLSFGDTHEGDERSERRIAVDVSGHSLRVKFVVSRGGRYRFELLDTNGLELVERSGHEISLELDAPPDVELTHPKESPLEVNRNDKVKLRFSAHDDFELGQARVAWRVLGTARKGDLALQVPTKGRRSFSGSTRFDLRKLKLQPGDHIAYTIEVFDNDEINGPKLGASETKELQIYSEKTHHARVMALELEALDALVHLLGDNLETPFSSVSDLSARAGLLSTADDITKKAVSTVVSLQKAAKAVRTDPIGRKKIGDAFEQAARELQRKAGSLRRAERSVRKEGSASRRKSSLAIDSLIRSQERMVSSMERQSVYLSDLIDDQRMIDAEALTKDLREQQRKLREALEAYKKAPSAEKRELISQAIQDIQKRIQEIMSELAKLRAEIPQDFVNADSVLDRAQRMQALQEKIEEGDLDGALRELDRMLNQTERMLSQLQEGREELQTREYSEITQQAEKLWNELSEVQTRQRDLADRTEKVAQSLKERSKDRLGDAKEFVEQQLKRLTEAATELEKVRPERHMPNAELFELTERRISDGKEALQNRDFGSAIEVLNRATKQMEDLDRDARRRTEQAERFGDVFGMGERATSTREALRKASPLVEEVLEALEQLSPDPNELLTPDERRQLDRFRAEQEALAKKAEEIQQGLESLGEQLPIVGPEVRSAIDEARSAMGQSGQQLGQGDAPGAVGQERRAVEALERLSQQLEEMGSQSGGGQGGSGVPLPFGQPRGSDREDERGGQGRFNRDRVEIPKPEQYQAPSEFREDILEAAKQGTIKSYREAVRRYYEELIK